MTGGRVPVTVVLAKKASPYGRLEVIDMNNLVW